MLRRFGRDAISRTFGRCEPGIGTRAGEGGMSAGDGFPISSSNLACTRRSSSRLCISGPRFQRRHNSLGLTSLRFQQRDHLHALLAADAVSDCLAFELIRDILHPIGRTLLQPPALWFNHRCRKGGKTARNTQSMRAGSAWKLLSIMWISNTAVLRSLVMTSMRSPVFNISVARRQ
jgi:hypothetical protein